MHISFNVSTINIKRLIYSIGFISSLCISSSSIAFEESNKLYEQALITYQKGDISTSIIHLKNVLKSNDVHMSARILLAQAYLKMGNGAVAEVELIKARNKKVDPDRLVTLFAHAYILQSKFKETLEITTPGNRTKKIETELLIYKGQALIGQKLYRSADVAFSDALILSPNNKLALLGRAQLALNARKPAKALEYVELSLASSSPFVNGWILKANILQQLGEMTKAIEAIDQALKIDPTHMAARLTKAMIHISIQEYALAEPQVDYIINEIPNEPRAGYLKAIISASLHKDDDQEGTKKLSGVITTLSAVPDEVMKTTPDYYFLAGLTNFQFGNLNDARRYLVQFLSYSPFNIDSVRMVATIDLQQGNLTSAKNLLIKTNLEIPNDPNILTLLGMTYLQLKDTNKAESYFKQVLAMFPTSEVGISNLAKTKMQSGQYQSAIDALVTIKNNQINGTQIKLLLIDAYQSSKVIDKALVIAKELITQFPEDSYFHQRLGVIYGLNNELTKARGAFNQALALDNENILAIIHLARMDNIENNSDKARKFLNEQLLKFPDNALIMVEISDSYLISNDIENGLLWAKKAYANYSNDFYVVRKLTSILVEKNALQETIDIVDAFIGQNNNIEALTLIASLYQKANQHKQAILALRDYVKKSFDKAPAFIMLAKAQTLAKDYSGAIQSYRKAIVADQNSLSAHLGLVNLIIKQKDEQYALSLINTIERITQSQSLKEVLLGDLYLTLENPVASKKHYLSALKLSPQKQALLGLYRSYKLENNLIAVIPHLQAWLKNKPDDLLVKISLADALRGSLQLQESVDYYEELLASHGQLPILLNNAANVYFSLGNQEKSLEYARKSYEYLNDNVAIIDTLAWIESRSGNHDKALGLFRRALTKDYDNAEIKYHIAVTLEALNRRIEAKKYLMEAIDSHQNFSEKKDAQLLLDSWL
ncbi:MAG: putative PEP-CTERM system TPR-repeat lipoprotein [Alteromonadaceae bacterium]|jgi:putative PEP-CTERM system TPR-repeat lipoprotein